MWSARHCRARVPRWRADLAAKPTAPSVRQRESGAAELNTQATMIAFRVVRRARHASKRGLSRQMSTTASHTRHTPRPRQLVRQRADFRTCPRPPAPSPAHQASIGHRAHVRGTCRATPDWWGRTRQWTETPDAREPRSCSCSSCQTDKVQGLTFLVHAALLSLWPRPQPCPKTARSACPCPTGTRM